MPLPRLKRTGLPTSNEHGRAVYSAPGLWQTEDERFLLWRRIGSRPNSFFIGEGLYLPYLPSDPHWRISGQDQSADRLVRDAQLDRVPFRTRRDALEALHVALDQLDRR